MIVFFFCDSPKTHAYNDKVRFNYKSQLVHNRFDTVNEYKKRLEFKFRHVIYLYIYICYNDGTNFTFFLFFVT